LLGKTDLLDHGDQGVLNLDLPSMSHVENNFNHISKYRIG